jgi:3-ketosteroid 9alpha-monooxygenase subunit A
MATTAEYGLGEFQYPRGWFMIADATEVTIAPMTVRFFGAEMVLYRGESGKVHLVEAYCPHMGAHLAKNTTSYIVRDKEQVQGESIRCPFHGWRFDEKGQCDDIPYSKFIPKAACLKTWPVIERAGIIWMWHDEEGGQPDYDLPDFGNHWDEKNWVRWRIDHMGDLVSHACEVIDNMVDIGHFSPIHGSCDVVHFANEFIGHKVYQYFSSGHRTLVSDAGVLETNTWYTGPGILQSEMSGGMPGLMMIANTPIDERTIRVWHALTVRANDGSHEITDEERGYAEAYQEAGRLALAQDVEIWANKRPSIDPMVIPADGPLGKLRIWYSQFYNPRERAGDIHTRVNGLVVKIDKRKEKSAA